MPSRIGVLYGAVHDPWVIFVWRAVRYHTYSGISLDFQLTLSSSHQQKERKKEFPYKEVIKKKIGAHVGYTVLWGKVSKEVRAGVQVCYCPAAPPINVMVVLSGLA